MKASEKLAKAVTEALNSNAEVVRVINAVGENAEQVKQAMYDMLWTSALMNDDELRKEIETELFEIVMDRIA